MKRRGLNIFWKSCISALLLLLAITVISYALLYSLLPHYYEKYKTEQFQALATELIENIENHSSTISEGRLIRDFAQEHNVSLSLSDSEQNILYDYQVQSSVTIEEDSSIMDTSNIAVTESTTESQTTPPVLSLSFHYELDGESRNLQIDVPLQPLTEAKSVIINIYPLAVLICIAFSFLLALLFSWQYARPLQTIRKVTHRMVNREPDAQIRIASSDEIGWLAEDINHLYEELNNTINTLKHELDKYSASENRRLDHFRTLSHELKTPLASANALLEGVLYEVPPYDQDKPRYLLECKEYLEKAIEITKDSLNSSKGSMRDTIESCSLKEMMAETTASYRPIIRSKQITYREEIPDQILLKTQRELFSKVLSNIISNAVNYTPTHGTIQVSLERAEGNKQALIIQNSCKPLSPQELSDIFSITYSGNSVHPMSNGFGLYIINQFLNVLRIPYLFKPTSSGDGMQFVMYVQDHLIHK